MQAVKVMRSHGLDVLVAGTISSHLLQLVLGVEIPQLEFGTRKFHQVFLLDSLALHHCLEVHIAVALDCDLVVGVTQPRKDSGLLVLVLGGIELGLEARADGVHAGKVR